MKVYCIDNRDCHYCYGNNRPVIGETYTVIGEWNEPGKKFSMGGEDFESEPGVYYNILELGDAVWYHSSLFIPLSSIDEKEFVREYKKETA
jgi:hypothetical protein